MAVIRYKDKEYKPNAAVTNAQKQMQAAQAKRPAAFAQGTAAANAQKLMQNAQAQIPAQYNQSAAVSNAQKQMQKVQGQDPGAYQQSAAVTAAQKQLAQIQANKPQAYNSKYSAQLDSILNQIQNQEQYKWSFDGDELFKYYADMYTQNGKQASMDAMGQAAALTGGYGNSYAQSAAGQQYQQYLLGLYDKGMELRDRAYQQFQDQRADLYNRYGALQGADESAYGRYRDAFGDWENEREYLANRADVERGFDYNKYQDAVQNWQKNRDYYTDLYGQERAFDYNKYQDLVENRQRDRDYYTDLYGQERAFDYNKYRDAVEDWERNRDYYTDLYNQESDRDYSRYADQRDYYRKVFENDRQFDEDVRQFGLEYALKKRGVDLEENELNWRKATDARDYNRNVLESDRAYNRGVLESDRAFNEQVRQANLDEAYRQATLDWNKYTDDRDYNRNVLENDRNYNRSVLESDRDYAERVRQYNENIAENARQFNESLKWDKMSNDQKYAAQYAMSILERGEMPSIEMLKAAGLSEEDARKLLGQMVPVGGSGGTGGNGGETGTGNDEEESYLDASQRVLQNTPDSFTVGELNGTDDERTLGDLKQNVVIDTARPGSLTPKAVEDIKNGTVKTTNSAKDRAAGNTKDMFGNDFYTTMQNVNNNNNKQNEKKKNELQTKLNKLNNDLKQAANDYAKNQIQNEIRKIQKQLLAL